MAWLKTAIEDPHAFATLTARLEAESARCRRDRRNAACIYASFATQELVWNDTAHALLGMLLELANVDELMAPPPDDGFVQLSP